MTEVGCRILHFATMRYSGAGRHGASPDIVEEADRSVESSRSCYARDEPRVTQSAKG